MLAIREGKSRPRTLAARAWHALAPPLGLQALFCDGKNCRRFTVAHNRLRRDGIFLAGAIGAEAAWLCSLECLESALLAHIYAEIDASAVPKHGGRLAPRMPHHLALLQKGVLQQIDLKRAQQHAKDLGMQLGEALLGLSLITEEQLAEAYARENGCAFYKPAPTPVLPTAVLPAALSLHFGAVTVHAQAERIVIGFIRRIDRGLLGMMAQMSGCRIEACFITERHFRDQLSIDRIPQADEAAAAKPIVAAHAIALQAAQLGSEQVQLACSRNWLWVRFRNKNSYNNPELHDVVFAIGKEALQDFLEEPLPIDRRLQSRAVVGEKNLCAH